MFKISVGDEVVVTYKSAVHNVNGAICKVIEKKADYVVFIAPTKEEGKGTNDPTWSLSYPGPYLKKHYPPLKIGDEVLITGFMFGYSPNSALPDRRGYKATVSEFYHGDTHIRVGGCWYPRESLSLNMNAEVEDDFIGTFPYSAKELEKFVYNPQPLTPLKPKPVTQYKVINRSEPAKVAGPFG